MNDSELNELLRQARVPERTSEQWDELQAGTVRGLASTRSEGSEMGRGATRPGWRLAAAWAFAGATACVLLFFAFGHRRASRVEPDNDLADARKLYSELNTLFPNQLEAVVFDGSTPRLLLAEQPSGNKGAPLFVRLCGAQGCQRVITFSGQRVSLNGESCEVLVDARGHVIVTGERFAWSSGDAATTGDYRIEAGAL